MIDRFGNASRVPELRQRILFTAGALAIFRLGVAIPTPGIDSGALAQYFEEARSTIFGLVNLFSGGALERFSIFALGIMPYISASIILQLLTVVVPFLERLSKEGEVGRRKITQYTRYGTIVLALIQGFFIAVSLESIEAPGGGSVVFAPGWAFRLMTIITLATGTSFIMWLGEQINERGIGNGISLMIFAGIVSEIPSALTATLEFIRQGELSIFAALLVAALMIGVIAAVILMERAQRRIPIQYARRMVGRKMYSGQTSHLPLKVNTAGVIPAIFASSILLFPATVANFIDHPITNWIKSQLSPGTTVYNLVFIAMIVFFAYFYTAIQFDPNDVAENLKKSGGYVPGIRPGPRTAEYINRVLSRVTLPGALYVAAVCVLPTILISQVNVPFYFGGTALLIVVGVALDTVASMETYLITRSYEGFMKRGRIRGRR